QASPCADAGSESASLSWSAGAESRTAVESAYSTPDHESVVQSLMEPEKPEVALAQEESTDLPEPLPDSFQVQESCSTPDAAESATEAPKAATTAEEKTLAQLLGPPA